MSLTLGTRLGDYEILEPIGAGGMGEVYRARDTKLGREVAIKVLPEAFSRDKDRLARFEARGAASCIGESSGHRDPPRLLSIGWRSLFGDGARGGRNARGAD